MSWDDQTNQLTRRTFLRLSARVASLALGLCLSPNLFAATKLETSSYPSHKPKSPRLLMLDPGHGGRDPGAIGLSGTHEKDITLDIARRMAEALRSDPTLRVHLTRDDDTFLPLQLRVQKARDVGADLFVSVHADSAPHSKARGLSVYTLSDKATDDFSKNLAEHENQADLMGGMDLPSADKDVTAILFDLAARRNRNLAQHTKANFVHSLRKKWPLLERPMRAADFVVLRAPDVPSMLIETGFLSNHQDEHLLRQPAEREKIARLMGKNISTIMSSPLFG